MVTTWNKSDLIATVIGPCSPRARVKKAYGKALKQSSHTSPGGGYTVGSHLFVGFDSRPGVLAPNVTAIGLFGSRPAWAMRTSSRSAS